MMISCNLNITAYVVVKMCHQFEHAVKVAVFSSERWIYFLEPYIISELCFAMQLSIPILTIMEESKAYSVDGLCATLLIQKRISP